MEIKQHRFAAFCLALCCALYAYNTQSNELVAKDGRSDQYATELQNAYQQILGKAPSSPSKHQKKWQKLADKAAHKHGVDPYLFRALINQESAWYSSVVSPGGAIGLTQLQPATAREVCGVKKRAALFDAATNLDCGAKFLSSLIQRFGSVKKALCAYNAGPNRIARLGRCPNYSSTKAYVHKIMSAWANEVYAPLRNLAELNNS